MDILSEDEDMDNTVTDEMNNDLVEGQLGWASVLY